MKMTRRGCLGGLGAVALQMMVERSAAAEIQLAQGMSPISRNVWIGAYAPPSPWEGMATAYQLEGLIGRKLNVVHIYKAWGNDWGRFDAQALTELRLAGSDGRSPLVTWEPWNVYNSVAQPEFRLANIVGGAYDDYIRSWANGLRSFGSRVYLRPMHEMNGDWYPWSGGTNTNTAALYVAAWRHIHQIFRNRGAYNVNWIWSPYAVSSSVSPSLESMYPGSRYVDILALDGYNWGTGPSGLPGPGPDGPSQWQSPHEVFLDGYRRVAALGTQPIWLTEVGCAEEGGNKGQWLSDLFNSTELTRVTGIVLFDAQKERDWRIASSPATSAEFARLLRSGY